MEPVLRLITFIADFAVYLLFSLFLYKASTISTKSKAYTQQGFRLSITLLTIYLQPNNRSVVFVVYVIRIDKKIPLPRRAVIQVNL